jgi:hypothetical protein
MGSLPTKRFSRRCKTRKRGGGIAASKPKAKKSEPVPLPPVPNKRVALFDLDGTLLFRTEVYGQWDLQYKRERAGLAHPGEPTTLTPEKIRPRPDYFFPEHSEFVYIRPGALEALAVARTALGAKNVHIFTASSNPDYVLEATGIAKKVNKVFTRIWTEMFFDQTGKYASKGSPVALKDFAEVRKSLELEPSDIVYLFDDHHEWVKNVTENDHAISVPVFMPPYELYGVAKTHNFVPDTIAAETTLLDVVRAKLFHHQPYPALLSLHEV